MAIHHTNQPLDGDKLRQLLLEVVAEYNRMGPGHMQSGPLLRAVAERLSDRQREQYAQPILVLFHDLFRNGHLAWGFDFANPGPPWCHVTERGREMLKHLSRDPANPAGYLAHLDQQAQLDPVARSYLMEALDTYNANCFKATAVMVGAAAERLVLRLRDALVARLTATSKHIPAGLNDWRVKTVRDALSKELEARKKDMPKALYESYGAYWLAFAEQARRVRNDAGHPESIDPVTPESVHAALLIFPELARLVADLEGWVNAFYV